MADKIDQSNIKPARGLWAAVRPDGRIATDTMAEKLIGAKANASWTYSSANWPYLRSIGWRIIRVDVIPHEETT